MDVTGADSEVGTSKVPTVTQFTKSWLRTLSPLIYEEKFTGCGATPACAVSYRLDTIC